MEKIGSGLNNLVKKAENATTGMASNLMKGGLAAGAAGAVLLGVAGGEATAVMKMAESVADLGHQQALLAEKFGLGAQQAGLWSAAADQAGVDSQTVGVGFKTLAKNMEALKLLDNVAQLKELNKQMLAGSVINPKVANQIEALQHRADDLATSHRILGIELSKQIAKHGAHSVEVMKATKALNDNNFAIQDTQEKIASLMQTESTATTVAAQHAQATLAAANAARPLQVVFNELGVGIFDAAGKLRPMNDVMLDIATKLSQMPDGAEKAGMAIKLFGRSGTDMLPLLDQGAAGIQKFMDQAQLSGKVLDDTQVKEAQAAYLAHKQLDQALQGVTVQLSMAFLPVLEKFLAILTPMLRNLADWVKHHEKLLSVLIPVVIGLTALLGIVLMVVGAIMTIAGVIMAWGVVTAALAPIMVGLGIAMGPILIIVGIFIVLAIAVWFAITHWKEITTIAGQVWQAIGDMVGKIGAFFGTMIDNVKAIWTEFWKHPLYYVGLAVGFIIGSVMRIQTEVGKWMLRMITDFISFLIQLPANAQLFFGQVITKIVAWAADALPVMKKGAGDLGKAMLDELGKLPGQVVSIGVNVAKGIIKGLLSVPGDIAKGAKDFGDGLLKGIKTAAHIQSPSALFAQEVGIPIALGIADGIRAGIPSATAALDALVSSSMHPVGPHLKGSASGAPAKATFAGGTIETLLREIRDLIANGALSGGGTTAGGKGIVSPSDVLAAFNHLVEAAQIQRGRGTRAGFVN